MHNLHLVVVKADSPQEACDTVESQISEFGNENNWRSICGCVSSKNKVLDLSKEAFGGRWSPSEKGYSTIAELNELVKGWINELGYGKTAHDKIAKTKGKLNLSKWTSQELWSLKEYANKLHEKSGMEVEFNILKNEFFAYNYIENGVTQMGGNGKETYVVFVDMHD